MRRYQWGILLAAIVFLIVWSLRETFEANQSIKAPPYDDTEALRIFGMLSAANQATLRQQAEQENPTLVATRTAAQQGLTLAQASPNLRPSAAASVRSTAQGQVTTAQSTLDAAKRALDLKAARLVTPAVETFFTAKFKPATVPLTANDITTYVRDLPATTRNKTILEAILTMYFVNQSGVGTSQSTTTTDGQTFSYSSLLSGLGQTAGYLIPNSGSASSGASTGAVPPPATSTGASAAADTADPICPAGTSIYTAGYGLPKCLAPGVTDFTCPSGYVPTANRDCRSTTTPSDTRPPQCPSGKEFNSNRGGCIAPLVTPECPSNYQLVAGNPKCVRISGTTSSSPAASPSASGSSSAMTSSGGSTGNTTGGSSASSFGPTAGGRAGGGAGRFMVWGPIGGGREEGDGVSPMDSTKTNKYPELLGGLGAGGDKTRIEGVGLAEPSSSWQLSMSGLLPDTSSLGVSNLSQFLPFSRSPGDMERIPDPYRVSQTYRTSSYTSKTEPVPFLADFSAFQK